MNKQLKQTTKAINFNTNFKAIIDVASGAKHIQYKKNIQN